MMAEETGITISFEWLRHLVAFADEGTVTDAALALKMSQSALTRSLQRLESEVGGRLFERSRNRLELTSFGRYCVAQARVVLDAVNVFSENVMREALKDSRYVIGSCAPGAIYELQNRLSGISSAQLDFRMMSGDELRFDLMSGKIHCAITEGAIEDSAVYSEFFMAEQLQLVVPDTHPMADRDQVSLRELSGMSILLLSNLGVWEYTLKPYINIHFIRQNNHEIFSELLTASNMPYISTNITDEYFEEPPGRTTIPMSGSEVVKTFYINSLHENKYIIQNLKN